MRRRRTPRRHGAGCGRTAGSGGARLEQRQRSGCRWDEPDRAGRRRKTQKTASRPAGCRACWPAPGRHHGHRLTQSPHRLPVGRVLPGCGRSVHADRLDGVHGAKEADPLAELRERHEPGPGVPPQPHDGRKAGRRTVAPRSTTDQASEPEPFPRRRGDSGRWKTALLRGPTAVRSGPSWSSGSSSRQRVSVGRAAVHCVAPMPYADRVTTRPSSRWVLRGQAGRWGPAPPKIAGGGDSRSPEGVRPPVPGPRPSTGGTRRRGRAVSGCSRC